MNTISNVTIHIKNANDISNIFIYKNLDKLTLKIYDELLYYISQCKTNYYYVTFGKIIDNAPIICTKKLVIKFHATCYSLNRYSNKMSLIKYLNDIVLYFKNNIITKNVTIEIRRGGEYSVYEFFEASIFAEWEYIRNLKVKFFYDSTKQAEISKNGIDFYKLYYNVICPKYLLGDVSKQLESIILNLNGIGIAEYDSESVISFSRRPDDPLTFNTKKNLFEDKRYNKYGVIANGIIFGGKNSLFYKSKLSMTFMDSIVKYM